MKFIGVVKLLNFNKKPYILLVFVPLLILYYFFFGFLVTGRQEKVDFININDYYNASYILENFETLQCIHGRPCSYQDEVDFRIIVLTFSRVISLHKLLHSLDELELDGGSAALEIWLDRNKEGLVCRQSLQLAHAFQWKKGSKRVTVQRHHEGIYGQWINSWRPRKPTEVVLILEDDMSVSKFVYRWLKLAHAKYSLRKDFAGVSLNGGDQLTAHNTAKAFETNATAFMYVCIGTWGFSPHSTFWADFQDWYHNMLNYRHIPMMQPPHSCYAGWCPPVFNNNSNTRSEVVEIEDSQIFHPYVSDAKPTEWYKQFEEKGTTNTMWEMWFIYFSTIHHRFTVYPFLNNAFSSSQQLDRYIQNILPPDSKPTETYDLCMGVNRKEAGLHYDSNLFSTTCLLVNHWMPSFNHLPDKLIKFDWNGVVISED